jgi:hypothetical protein
MTTQGTDPAVVRGARQRLPTKKEATPANTGTGARPQAGPYDPVPDILRIVMLLRREGASVRCLAKFLGVSKSAMHRYLPGIELLVSQMGHGEDGNSQNSFDDRDQAVPSGTPEVAAYAAAMARALGSAS